MEADTPPARTPPAAPTAGGSVEPVHQNLDQVMASSFRSPTIVDHPPTTVSHYELRDPFEQVTYRMASAEDIARKAVELGRSRFIEVGPQGERTPFDFIRGRWHRGGVDNPEPAAPRQGATRARDNEPRSPDGEPRQPIPPESAASREFASIGARAERDDRLKRIAAALNERYIVRVAPLTLGGPLIRPHEYRFLGDTSRVAFTASKSRLTTDANTLSVARSMVDLADIEGWRVIRVSGHDDFKRRVWIEATARGIRTLGHDPAPLDIDLMNKEREARQINRIEPEVPFKGDSPAATATSTTKSSSRGSGGRKTVLAAIEALLVAKGVPKRQREAVMVAVSEQLEQRVRAGQAPKVKVYDKAAPSQRPAVMPSAEIHRTRERTAPTR